jgi:hypothetical protein
LIPSTTKGRRKDQMYKGGIVKRGSGNHGVTVTERS